MGQVLGNHHLLLISQLGSLYFPCSLALLLHQPHSHVSQVPLVYLGLSPYSSPLLPGDVLLPTHCHGIRWNLKVLFLLCAHSADNYSEEEYESFSSEQEASDDAVQGQVTL